MMVDVSSEDMNPTHVKLNTLEDHFENELD